MSFFNALSLWVYGMTFRQQCILAVVVIILIATLLHYVRKGLVIGYLWVCSVSMGIPLEELCEDYSAEYRSENGWC